MKPYYEQDGITIYHGDCRDILDRVEADVVLTDPPYGIDYDPSHRKLICPTGLPAVVGDDEPFDPSPFLGRPFILWGANCYASRLPDIPTWLCWDKVTRNGLNLRIAECEFAATNCVGRSRVFRHLWSGGYRASESGCYLHPTQKPIALMRWCLELHGVPNGTVLDPFIGSGTTLVAAKQLGRRAIGIEIEERYCELAAKRLSQTVMRFEPTRREPEQTGML